MTVTILGSAAGGGFQGRNYTAQLLKTVRETFLIDCGEGTQHQLYRCRVRYDDMKQIFISHLHGDHVFGLMGLLTSFCLKKRTEPMLVYGPAGLRELIETTSRLAGVYYTYEVIIHEVDTTVSAKIFETAYTEVWTIPLAHRTLCTGYLFREKPKQSNILPEKIAEYGIPIHAIKGIKAGADYQLPDGRTVRHTELTTPPKPSISYAFCSDTAPSPIVVEVVKSVTCLYHEATFIEENLAEAAYSGHSTAAQAAHIAKAANVGQLLMGHFSSRYKDVDQHLIEAKQIFDNTLAVEEGQTYLISAK